MSRQVGTTDHTQAALQNPLKHAVEDNGPLNKRSDLLPGTPSSPKKVLFFYIGPSSRYCLCTQGFKSTIPLKMV